MPDGSTALFDTGFANIGARPTRDDQGVGVTDPFGNPLSFTRQFVQNPAGPTPDKFQVNLCALDMPFLPCNAVPDGFSALATQRVAVDGAVKVPSLRNVALTPPYFHNGGQGTLAQVVQFYSRGGDRRDVTGGDTTGTGPLGEDDPLAVAPRGSNLHPKIKDLGLSAQDQSNLVAFLRSLTDDRVRCHAGPFDHPELAISNGVDPEGTPDGVKAHERTVTLAAVGNDGIGAVKCSMIQNAGNVGALPATLKALSE
jgi:hypothetical protein